MFKHNQKFNQELKINLMRFFIHFLKYHLFKKSIYIISALKIFDNYAIYINYEYIQSKYE